MMCRPAASPATMTVISLTVTEDECYCYCSRGKGGQEKAALLGNVSGVRRHLLLQRDPGKISQRLP